MSETLNGDLIMLMYPMFDMMEYAFMRDLIGEVTLKVCDPRHDVISHMEAQTFERWPFKRRGL